MAKKLFVRARVVKKGRWHIDYTIFDTVNGTETRHRRDFGLNDILSIEVRTEVARIISDHIETFVGNPVDRPIAKTENPVSVSQAVTLALNEKLKLPRKNSHRGYKSISKALLTWCKSAHLEDLPVKLFTRKNARAYWDYLTDRRKYRNVTLQNYRTHLGGLWTEMINREIVEVSPWANIKPPPTEEKYRRPFTDIERITVANEADKTDYWLFRAILLQFYCYIRPVEITRLKFKDFDLGRGVVVIQSGNAKKWKKRVATIPASVMHYFRDGRFDKYPANYFVLGKFDRGNENYKVEPSMVQVDDDRMYRRHKKLLERLVKLGKLANTVGLSWYSWKDTGISKHTRNTSPVATKDQAGHRNLSVTSLYYHAEEINAEYQNLSNDLIE